VCHHIQLAVWLPCDVSRGKELTWAGAFGPGGGVTVLAASHCFRVLSYTAVISRPKALLQAKVITLLPLMPARTGWLDNGRETGKFFWWGGHALALPAM